ncbi:biotin/lipoyl-binding carrier protein [Aestuariimicrobium sp. p3-SID1156]|uniref:biotin/lipoyl-binding carrier protein n=1 Tax=Aestuariimicrobium sp. p3-SID1156 TaxID=2916038 RepID=UPI00223BAF91|nr:biotin/lipoyl-binding carrier protein [Aestuariimicrobium sp. p3-SID1156]MCT1459566.1 biotin/lipoyl-binding carrier protein [Aestuariimicrobium sp. p3-SID1156]
MTHAVTAEIVATVLSVDVEVGATVGPLDAVIVLESMKMEIPVLADVSGTVVEISVKPGDVVHDGDPMMMIEEA